ncbi:MAG: S-adenosyl-l-methionine hydroxide adenosyltransferase family protein [Gammaproteobacteria bacterium]|jgi:S-adenosylmethionine hydrolase|nr:S-adenosyl-l-methionine hydroxide adenosyltransferase family protein [Gammaproteobacteria bacterium]MDH3748964.1 S-adenosyl-l-methionine hydroxide adenosyltransferase family protein [Gammaproteobacteria bacterium]MDH3804609.1 S-adenosyl-l-methionine hydroxide adenosyltransferase family protein [Gammaproteobacteria bacterium]
MFRALSLLITYSLIIALTTSAAAGESRRALVLLSDFGTTERFVASMKGVALSVDPELQVHDLTHHIEPFNIWQASYMLAGTIDYWPKGTVFVSVVDPGVGTDRHSVVVKTSSGHYVVTPDNGSLTLTADAQGILEVRQIDEAINRRPGSESSHTFHGRDVYAYTGARLAAAVIEFDDVGPLLEPNVVRLNYQQPEKPDNNTIIGNITHIEMPFGNIVTNIPKSMADALDLAPEDNTKVFVEISRAGESVFRQSIPYVRSFAYVDEGQPLLYSDSLQTIGLAVNGGNFAHQFDVKAGADWTIRLVKLAAQE